MIVKFLRLFKAYRELEDKHWNECWQIAMYDDELRNNTELAKPIHASWVPSSPFTDTMECSNCGYNILSDEFESPYCPWCGAKMEEKDGE